MRARCRVLVDAPLSARRRGKLFRVLAVLVLAGLWLMHGVSATTGAGCHGVPVLMPMGASVSAASAMPIAMPAGAAGVSVAEHGDAMRSGSSETCLSGQPPSPGAFLLGLLACLALIGLAFDVVRLPEPPSCAVGRLRRRGPPGPVGRALLTTVCVSRT